MTTEAELLTPEQIRHWYGWRFSVQGEGAETSCPHGGTHYEPVISDGYMGLRITDCPDGRDCWLAYIAWDKGPPTT